MMIRIIGKCPCVPPELRKVTFIKYNENSSLISLPLSSYKYFIIKKISLDSNSIYKTLLKFYTLWKNCCSNIKKNLVTPPSFILLLTYIILL